VSAAMRLFTMVIKRVITDPVKSIIRVELESKTVPLSEEQSELKKKVLSSIIEVLKGGTHLFEEPKVIQTFEASDEERQILMQQKPAATLQAPDLTHTGGVIHNDGTRTHGIFDAEFDNGIESLPGWIFKKGDKFIGEDDSRGIIRTLLPAEAGQPDRYLIHFYTPKEALIINREIFEQEYKKLT
jgi:hypothetical protein